MHLLSNFGAHTWLFKASISSISAIIMQILLVYHLLVCPYEISRTLECINLSALIRFTLVDNHCKGWRIQSISLHFCMHTLYTSKHSFITSSIILCYEEEMLKDIASIAEDSTLLGCVAVLSLCL